MKPLVFRIWRTPGGSGLAAGTLPGPSGASGSAEGQPCRTRAREMGHKLLKSPESDETRHPRADNSRQPSGTLRAETGKSPSGGPPPAGPPRNLESG